MATPEARGEHIIISGVVAKAGTWVDVSKIVARYAALHFQSVTPSDTVTLDIFGYKNGPADAIVLGRGDNLADGGAIALTCLARKSSDATYYDTAVRFSLEGCNAIKINQTADPAEGMDHYRYIVTPL
jgi:hypothetical protein